MQIIYGGGPVNYEEYAPLFIFMKYASLCRSMSVLLIRFPVSVLCQGRNMQLQSKGNCGCIRKRNLLKIMLKSFMLLEPTWEKLLNSFVSFIFFVRISSSKRNRNILYFIDLHVHLSFRSRYIVFSSCDQFVCCVSVCFLVQAI